MTDNIQKYPIEKSLRVRRKLADQARARSSDVIVVGGGPAGCIVARRLALDGIRVVLLTGATTPGCEGLSRRTREFLLQEGMESSVASLRGPMPRGGEWGAGRAVAGVEWLADRTELVIRLREAAAAAGVVVKRDIVTRLKCSATGWCLDSRNVVRHEAPIVIDARGRRGPEHRGPLLLALGQSFHRSAVGMPRTGIHPTRDGWCWLVEERDTVWVQLVGRPRRCHPARWLAASIAQIPALARALDGAVPCETAVARPAHARLSRANEEHGIWRVGDAALALDPLSGQGVYEALRDARLIATAVRSVSAGNDVTLSRRFVADRRQETWRRAVAAAASFYGENAARGPFWSQVASAYAALIPPHSGEATRIERRPVLDEDRILERDVIVTAGNPRGVWHVAGVPLVTLKGYLDTAEGATSATAAAALDRPQAAVASATQWLRETGTMLRQVPSPVS